MIRIKLDKDNFLMSFDYNKDTQSISKQINLSRSKEELLETTFQKIKSKLQLNEVTLKLCDLENVEIPLNTKNVDSWKENYIFNVENQHYKVKLNLPSAKKLKLSKKLFAGMPIFVKLEADNPSFVENLHKFSIFSWFISDLVNNEQESQWKLIKKGIGQRVCYLNEDWANRLIKVECIPKNDQSECEGMSLQLVSNKIEEKLDLNEFPMTQIHKLTENFLISKK